MPQPHLPAQARQRSLLPSQSEGTRHSIVPLPHYFRRVGGEVLAAIKTTLPISILNISQFLNEFLP